MAADRRLFASTPTTAPSAPPGAPSPISHVRLAAPQRTGGGWARAAWIVLGLAGWWVLQFLLGTLGLGTTLVTGLVALVPLALCFAALRYIDRWDPEPGRLVAFAVLWGAAPAVALALVSGGWFEGAALSAWGELAIAPVTEEIAKGLGLLLLVALARRHVHGAVDGVVYGGLIGAGFAFTENILYFSVALADGGEAFGSTVLGRGVLSPFAHVLFTAMTGAAVGWATERVKGFGGLAAAWCLGLLPAMACHYAWNALASGATPLSFASGYLMTQVPLFVAAVVIALLLVRRERALTVGALREYQALGWYTEQEVATLASPRARRETGRWAANRGAKAQWRHVVATADALAVIRQRQRMNPGNAAIDAEQARLLHRSLTAREALRAAVSTGPGGWTATGA
ncbi:MAG: PrsW family intramembrane metalloprotease [Arthrobacter sp.]|jgi:RsiW-degrading membrane proteinase PrsW (M82 family)|nr:PrsW family intramembrane metalloprotease [Arthrobacter sp.]